ncbi:MAG: hypothetical protein JW829_06300 [Pirellulales bacterium]|nr:hypothetical protein [Pirellulales bacterium]
MRWFWLKGIAYGCIALVFVLAHDICRAETVPVMFGIDNAHSGFTLNLTIDTSFGDDSGSGSSAISGSILANLTIDPSGGTPLIKALDFAGPVAGNRFTIDEDLEYHFTFLFIFKIDATGSDLAGYPSTPAPPARVTSLGAGDLNYEFDAALHEFTLNEGTISYSGIASGEYNLADTPFGGSPPTGTMGSIELTQGATHGDLTDFTARIEMPFAFLDSLTDEETGITVTWDVDGTVVGVGNFAVDIGLGGTPGDFDDDGDVDGDDFLTWQDGFGMTSGAVREDGDANGDGAVNAQDLALWKSNFGTVASPSDMAITAVPEPAACCVAGMLLLCGLGMGRIPRPRRF